MISSSPDTGQRDLCLALYGMNDAEKINAIANKDLFSLLEKTSGYRNRWKGHSGIVSAKEHARRHTLLQEELTRLRTIFGAAFEDWWLIRPGDNQYTGGIFHFRAERLTGSRQIFKQIGIESLVVMDSKEIYFFDATTQIPLKILHFFRMMPSPETEETACYFYNRIEKDSIRWVSYHFESNAERVEPDLTILKVIAEVEEHN